MIKLVLYIALIALSFSPLIAQNDTNFHKVKVFDPLDYSKTSLDTNIHSYGDYQNLFDKDLLFVHSKHGAYVPLTYETNKWVGRNPFQFNNLELPSTVFMTAVPFTRIEGLTGSRKEEYLDFVHTQNPLYNWNLGLRYKFFRDEGSYEFATTRKFATQLYSYYKSMNERYINFIQLKSYGGKYQENFGVDPLYLLDSNISNSNLLGVNNFHAQHRSKELNFSILQQFFLNKNDSANIKSYIKQNFVLSTSSHAFEDKNPIDSSIYYPNYVTNATFIYDSVRTGVINIPLSIGFSHPNWNNETTFKHAQTNYYSKDSVWVPIQYKYHQESLDNKFQFKRKKIEVRSNMEYIVGGMNKTNYSTENSLVYQVLKINLKLEADQFSKDVLPYWRKFNNVYTDWDTTFLALKESKYALGLSNKWFELKGENRIIENHIYFDGVQPQQSTNKINYTQLLASVNIDQKKWGIKLRGIQQSSSDTLLSVPEWIGKIWLYKKGSIFKEKMQVEFGVLASYYSSFMVPSYNPYWGTTSPQNQQGISSYPTVDFYLSGKVNKARFYFRAEHLNQGFTGFNYYSNIGNNDGKGSYPLAGRTLKFGLILDLYN